MNWLTNGIIGVIFYGFFALFNKLSSGTDNISTNFIIQATYFLSTAMLLLVLRKQKFSWSTSAFIAGLCGSTGTWIVLTALEKNHLIIVYPFAALSSIVFIACNFLFYKVTYTGRKLTWLLAGMIISCTGLFFAAVGGSGGLPTFVQTFAINTVFLAQGISVLILWGLTAFFWFKSRVMDKAEASTTLWWSALGSVLVVCIMLFIHPSSIANIELSLYPILSGRSILGGSYFILQAFGQTKTASSIKNVVLAILTNGEIIPVTLFALIILQEYSLEGMLGSVASIIGIILLNVADAVEA